MNTPATLDREVALLKRMLSYAVETGLLNDNPLSGAALLNEPNVREFVLSESAFAKLYEGAEPYPKPILALAYDTGMRLLTGAVVYPAS